MSAMTQDRIDRIEKTCDATKQVCMVLAPLTERAQRRLLVYFTDLVNDPDEGGSLAEVELLRQVQAMLGHEAPR